MWQLQLQRSELWRIIPGHCDVCDVCDVRRGAVGASRRESASRPQSFCAQRCWASVTGHHGHHGHHGIKHGGIWRCNALLTWILKLKWILEHVLHGTIYRIYRQRAQLELGRHSVSRILKINCNNDQFQILVISCSNLFPAEALSYQQVHLAVPIKEEL